MVEANLPGTAARSIKPVDPLPPADVGEHLVYCLIIVSDDVGPNCADAAFRLADLPPRHIYVVRIRLY
jgi:hypothetical protein